MPRFWITYGEWHGLSWTAPQSIGWITVFDCEVYENTSYARIADTTQCIADTTHRKRTSTTTTTLSTSVSTRDLDPSSIYHIRRLADSQFCVSDGNRLLYAGPVCCFTKPTRRNVIHLRPALLRDRYRDRSDFTGEVWTRPSLESAALPTIKGRVWLRAAIILVTTDRAAQSGQEDTYEGELLQRICHAWTC